MKNPNISELESMVISWVNFFSGDDGSMPPGELGELDQNALKALKKQGLQSQITLVAGIVLHCRCCHLFVEYTQPSCMFMSKIFLETS